MDTEIPSVPGERGTAELSRIPSLFDAPAESRAVTPPARTAKVDEADEIFAEISEGEAESSASDEVEEADAEA